MQARRTRRTASAPSLRFTIFKQRVYFWETAGARTSGLQRGQKGDSALGGIRPYVQYYMKIRVLATTFFAIGTICTNIATNSTFRLMTTYLFWLMLPLARCVLMPSSMLPPASGAISSPTQW